MDARGLSFNVQLNNGRIALIGGATKAKDNFQFFMLFDTVRRI